MVRRICELDKSRVQIKGEKWFWKFSHISINQLKTKSDADHVQKEKEGGRGEGEHARLQFEKVGGNVDIIDSIKGYFFSLIVFVFVIFN